ncbi:hypothetical protein BCR32DRAFT_294565 [Anaeromyces robustus]|uniref:G-protein coupled receptors family 3 profile domain-containing protein n=1 Tax=Anaeromyces robustus TaxID=1754192 RepID=A0A1Y1X0T3_9FUNG|nr:hypothetical protein BCR32DRAFT_294565 [Anaeromyces robustus]|eukprot:ORX79208.1 hypothetical protein BCR32DRAFT_294565 [Anaeromyces robustus]
MKKYYKFIFLIFFYILIYCINGLHAQNTITILTREPELGVDVEEFEYLYETKVNEYFTELNKDDPVLKDYNITFIFYNYGNMTDRKKTFYYRYMLNLISYIEVGDCDMAIVEDRVLFTEEALMESDFVEYYIGYRQPTIGFFNKLNKNNIIKNLDLSYNDPKMIHDAKFKNDLYGLPYELDFDVLYYNNENEKTNDLVSKMESLTWDDLILLMNMSPNVSLDSSIGEENDLLNFFTEYVSNHYNLTEEYDKNYFKVLYNETGESIFNSLYDTVAKYSNGNTEDTVLINNYDAYYRFLDRDSGFFKGRASYYPFLINDEHKPISVTLPPKYITAIIEKYLVVNNESQINEDILAKVAMQLTSKEFQLFKAENFGSIPTFDISKKESDSDIKLYCNKFSHICNLMDKMKRIYVKDIFSTKYSVPFFEIGALLVKDLKYFLIHTDEDSIETILFDFKNANELVTFDLGIYGVLAYIITILVVIFSIIIIFFVNKYKDHPYLKVISPIFCEMIIVGCTLNMTKTIQDLPPYSEIGARIYFMIWTISDNLIYIPMFVVTYRIYRIYQSSGFMTRSLNNSRLLLLSIIIMSISIIFRFIITCTDDFYYFPFGSLRDPRYPEWVYNGYDTYSTIYQTYMQVIFIALLFMIITTGNVVNKFGDICYTFVIFSLNIVDFISNRLLHKLYYSNFAFDYFIITLFKCIACLSCIYFLVGSRLIFIILYNPPRTPTLSRPCNTNNYSNTNYNAQTNKNNNNNNDDDNSLKNLSDYVALRPTKSLIVTELLQKFKRN